MPRVRQPLQLSSRLLCQRWGKHAAGCVCAYTADKNGKMGSFYPCGTMHGDKIFFLLCVKMKFISFQYRKTVKSKLPKSL